MPQYFPLSSPARVVGVLTNGRSYEKDVTTAAPLAVVDREEEAFLRAQFPTVLERRQANAVPNPTAATNATGWSAYNGGVVTTTLARQTATSRPGAVDTNCFRATRTAGTGHLGMSVGLPALGIRRDYSRWFWTAWVRPSTAQTVTLYYDYSINGAFLSQQVNVAVAANTWAFMRGPDIVWPSEAAAGSGTLYALIFNAPNGTILDVDDMLVSEQESVYFDGASAGARWEGTAHASVSTRVA